MWTLKFLGNNTKYTVIIFLIIQSSACVHKPPTIAHTHIGHAITAFDGSPDQKGLFSVAEERANTALRHAEAALREGNSIHDIKKHIDAVVTSSGSDDFGLRLALAEAAKHIEFAASVPDASANVRSVAPSFRIGANSILDRCDLILLLGNDVADSDSAEEIHILAQQIGQVAKSNVNGDGDDLGITHLRSMLDELVNDEDPPYVTVDRWYLFHLVRLPNCETCWAWRKWANSSNRGY